MRDFSLVAFAKACLGIILAGMTLLPLQGFCSFDTETPQLLLQKEREAQLRKQQELTPDVRLSRTAIPPRDAYPLEEKPCFPITHITLVGNSAESFQFALRSVTEGDDKAIGRCLGAEGINVILTRVQNAVVAAGFVTTRVLAAPQDLKSGELVLTLIAGRIHAIRVAPDADPRGTMWNALPMRSGDLLNLRDIEQGLENLKRVPTAEADIQIEPATGVDAKNGDSDLVVRYQQMFPFRLSFSADDSGSKSTGKRQGSVTLSFDNWWTLNDLFYISVNRDIGERAAGDRGTQGHTVHYSLPLGYWNIASTVSKNRYRQTVIGASENYLYWGISENAEVKLARLVYRNAVRKITLSLRGLMRTSNNYIDDTEVLVQRRRTAGWESAINHREFFGNSSLDSTLAYRRGTGAFAAMPAPEDALGEGTARFKIITADSTLSVPFTLAAPWGTQALRYNGNWRAQWNRTPLTPQDRFSIGGRYTVRGFNGENTLSAERGWLIRNDLSFSLGDSGQEIYLGYDDGRVGGRFSNELLGKTLSGRVLGWRGAWHSVNYDVFVGEPVKRPQGFVAPSTISGFVVYWSL